MTEHSVDSVRVPFRINGLDHLVLRVRDIDASRQFYEGVLGCSLERELPDLGLYQLRCGAQLIDLVLVGTQIGGDKLPDQQRRNQDHFCINVVLTDEGDAHEQILAHLDAHGVKPVESGERYGAEGFGWSVYVTDPDDNVVEIKPAISG